MIVKDISICLRKMIISKMNSHIINSDISDVTTIRKSIYRVRIKSLIFNTLIHDI